MKQRALVLVLAVAAITLFVSGLAAQSSTTGRLSGTVTDSSGAIVPSASVELRNTATGAVQKQSVNASGQYVFPSVAPGEYTVRVTADGFRTGSVAGMQVDVAKSYVQDVKLEVGQLNQTVEVTAEVRAELQTVDAAVGNVIPGKSLPTMPLFSRQVHELVTAQPGVTPTGEVSGARSDQLTYTLDGIDVTNNSVGGAGTGGTFMYLGVESIEEFRVGVANPNASFGRGSGGQASMISRRGGNDYHGSGYWFHQNDNLNANTWTNNRVGIKKPEIKDNRFGFTAGGPVWKDKTYLFLNYDGRRFPQQSTVTRIVPRDTLRQGILVFQDQAGNKNQYDLKTSTACGPAGTDPCDPRRLGLSPTVTDEFKYLPTGNDASQGDGLNTIGLTVNVGNPINFDFYNARLDHNLTDKWRLDASIRYFSQLAYSNAVIDIRTLPAKSVRLDPTRQNMESIGVSGAVKPNLTAEFRFGRVRNRTATGPQRPNASAGILNLVGTSTSAGPIAIDIGGRGGAQSILSEPFDVDTQLARRQENDNRIYQFNSDFNWVKSKHTMQFGFHFRNLPTLHRRDDKVLGSLGALVAEIDSNSGVLNLPSSIQPPACSATRTTGCLRSADAVNWNRLFAGVTGLLDSVTVLAVRDGSFKPLPFGSLLESDTHGIHAPDFYWQDVWRITPGLTLTYGLNYGWQTPPTEALGRYTIQIDQATGQQITTAPFFAARLQGATSGTIVNPNFAFVPIDNANSPVFNTDWGNIGPRVSAAWNPSGGPGFLHKIFGDKKTVIRGGYSLIYDKENTVQSVIIPSLGVAFAQTLNVNTPLCNISGAGGAGCTPGSSNTALNNFRVGVDGTIPVPTVPAQSIPASPPWGLINGSVVQYPELLSFQVDPNLKTGRNHAMDFTIQRELPGKLILELTYSGRYARRLPQSMNLTNAVYMQLDKASGQTFAQAFDNVANALRAGNAAPSQPWFQNSVPGGTAAVVSAAGNAAFINGNVASVYQNLDRLRMANNLAPFNNYMSQMAMLRTSIGFSNYNGLFVTLRRPLSKGLFYEATYTYSKSLDQIGGVQNSANVLPNSFDLYAEYGPSGFDIRHIVNTVVSYDLPFKMHNPFLNRVIGGWNISGIYTGRSGDPVTVAEGSQIWGCCTQLGNTSPGISTVPISTFSTTKYTNIPGSNNTGTTGNPATGGSGLNLFSDPASVFSSFRKVNIATDTRSGRGNPLRGMGRWNIDFSLAKDTAITERIHFRISADFFNILNKVDFSNPGPSLTSQTSFGVISSQLTPANRTNGARWIQLSARVSF